MMRCMAWALVAAVVTTGNSPCPAAEPIALLELKIGTERLEGRIAAHNDDTCWLLRRDGRLASFRTDDVTDYHEIEPRFRPMSMLDLRDQLQTEFGRGFETRTTAHYVVVARRGTGERYATLFEQIYRQFHTYFTVRGFRIAEPEFPMVAVVLPDQQSFVDYCIGEGAKPQPNLVGYYLPSSNRVALYDRAAVGQSRASDVDDTVIHEATHQVAFNTGVHSRIGQSPLWLVEGLATLFEAEGIRHRATVAAIGDRINPERLDGFADYRKRRPANSLEAFVGDDALFKKSPLDAYAQAWALTFYLAETRSVEFAKYLKIVAGRNPLEKYEPDVRVKDFRDTFGRDLDFLESGMIRFYDRLRAE